MANSQMHHVKPVSKGYMLSDSMTFWKRQTIRTENRPAVMKEAFDKGRGAIWGDGITELNVDMVVVT